MLDTQTLEKRGNHKKNSAQFMHYLYTPLSVNGAPFIAKLSIEEYDIDGKLRAYNLQAIKMPDLSRAQYSEIIKNHRGKYAYKSSAISVSQLFEFVKEYDKDFKYKPADPKTLNENNEPINGTDRKQWKKQISNFFRNSLKGTGSIEIETIEGDILHITYDTSKKSKNEYCEIKGKRTRLNDEEYMLKLKAEAHLDELAEISISIKDSSGNKKIEPDRKKSSFC